MNDSSQYYILKILVFSTEAGMISGNLLCGSQEAMLVAQHPPTPLSTTKLLLFILHNAKSNKNVIAKHQTPIKVWVVNLYIQTSCPGSSEPGHFYRAKMWSGLLCQFTPFLIKMWLWSTKTPIKVWWVNPTSKLHAPDHRNRGFFRAVGNGCVSWFAFVAVSSHQSDAVPDPQSAVGYKGQFRTKLGIYWNQSHLS